MFQKVLLHHLALYHKNHAVRRKCNICLHFLFKYNLNFRTYDSIWSIKMGNQTITEDQREKLNELPFKCTKSSKLPWLKYRINQYILTTNVTLFKYLKIATKLCSFCIQKDETILPILWSCPKEQDLLSSFKNPCEKNDLNFAMDGGSFILGFMLQLPNEHNFVFMCIKLYIYRKRCLQETLH